MVREQLQRDDRQQRRERFGRVGHIEHVVGVASDVRVALGGDGEDARVARADLLHVADHLVVRAAARGDRDERRPAASSRAIGPCFSSPAGYASAWT